MKTVTIIIDGRTIQCAEGTPVGELAPSRYAPSGLPYICAVINNDVSSLSYPLSVNSDVTLLTMASSAGWRIYRQSLSFLLAMTVRTLFPHARFSLDHSFGLGIYCSFYQDDGSLDGITAEQLAQIDQTMRELVRRDIPIERQKISFNDAVKAFTESGQVPKLNLLKYRNPPRVVVHACEGFSDLAHGPIVQCTGVLNKFELIHYKPGFVLHLPDRADPCNIPPFEDQPQLFHIIQEHKEWGRILGVSTVGRLNEIIARGEIDDFVRTAEALHEKKLAKIAESIAQTNGMAKVILIAGPSSAGKTTFAKRLAIHLKVNGLRPHTIGTDDYFVGAERNPVDEDGKPDYEHVDAVDIELFNHHMNALIEGRSVELPTFDFHSKQPSFLGTTLKLGPDEILIIEGIHGLNPKLTCMIPPSRKYRIYINALTQLSVDLDNRISTTDVRLMRRMVRDHRTRGHTPLATLQMWPSVRRGEKRWIFPFQKEADATFNSALDYELAVLKPLIEPLLQTVKPTHTEYAEARRLSEFLLSFLPMADTLVPGTSILREHIGGSSFKY
jgi:uridine kinase